jgi:LacI family transcriptional regulator
MSSAGAILGRSERSKVTLEVIAKTLGVSTATVSLALRNNPVVAEITKKKVQKVARDLGYIYNRSAAALRTSRSNILGVAFHDIRNPFFAEMLASLVEAVEETGRSILLGSCKDDLERQSKVLETLKEHRPDGIIVCPVSGSDGDHLNHILAAGIPIVQVARRVEGIETDFVGADDEKGVQLAMAHLVGLGHKRIAFIGGDRQTSVGNAKLDGYFKALDIHGIARDEALLFAGPVDAATGRQAIEHWLNRNDRPSAFLCFNDSVALGALAAAAEHSIDVPGELSIVGSDDVDMATLVRPRLTTIHRNHNDIARKAAELIASRIEDPERDPLYVVMEPTLIIRESSAPPAPR